MCEDPEIRERLEQLRNEQELKRTTDAQPSRVRRTQSTKHSIRRTSMRQKTLTPKKDVKEEARIRLGVEGSMVRGEGKGVNDELGEGEGSVVRVEEKGREGGSVLWLLYGTLNYAHTLNGKLCNIGCQTCFYSYMI